MTLRYQNLLYLFLKLKDQRRWEKTVYVPIWICSWNSHSPTSWTEQIRSGGKREVHLVLLVFSPWGKAFRQILANACEQKGPMTAAPRLSSESALDPSVSPARWLCDHDSHISPLCSYRMSDPAPSRLPEATWSWAQAAFQGHWCKWENKENVVASHHWGLGVHVLLWCSHTYPDTIIIY